MQGPVLPDGPAWLLGISIAGWVLVNIVRAVTGIKRNGHLPPEVMALIQEARRDFQTHTVVLQSVTVTLTALTERIAHLPTREDLSAIAEKNRHDYANK